MNKRLFDFDFPYFDESIQRVFRMPDRRMIARFGRKWELDIFSYENPIDLVYYVSDVL